MLTSYNAQQKVNGRKGSGVRECGIVETVFGIIVIIVALLLVTGLWPG
jgi:hypothetical protein